MGRRKLEELEAAYDVVIIGAGATGCATAKELAGRGYSTLLIDRGDIASGTSSRSSRLLYCGLAYMKPPYPLWKIPLHPIDMAGRLYRAWLTMHCRTELVREMPDHFVRLPFYFPYAGHGGRQAPNTLIDLGFRLIARFASRDVPLSYRRLKAHEAGDASGLIRHLGDPLRGVGHFQEYQYDWPERICVDTALEAERLGATVRTYTEVAALDHDGAQWRLELREKAPGSHGETSIVSRMVVNAAGPWVDNVLAVATPRDEKRNVLGVKGVNVMVKLPDDCRGQGLQTFSSRGEPLYLFPWRDLHFIGPTEDRVNTNPDHEKVLDEEVDYLLGEVNRLFPSLHLTHQDVIHAWCGVRPGSTRDGQTLSGVIQLNERDDVPNLVSVTGVMIMQHRHAARKTAKLVAKRLGVRPNKSADERAKPRVIHRPELSHIDEERIKQMVQEEHVTRLVDLMRRRLPYGWAEDLGVNRLEDVSMMMAKTLGWSEQQRQSECRDYLAEIADNFMVGKTASDSEHVEKMMP